MGILLAERLAELTVRRGEVDPAGSVEEGQEEIVLDMLYAELGSIELDAVVVAVGGEHCAREEVALLGVEGRHALPHRHLHHAPLQPQRRLRRGRRRMPRGLQLA